MTVNINWDWVRDSVIKAERIKPIAGNAAFELARSLLVRAESLAKPKTMLVKKAISSIGRSSINLTDGPKLTGKILSAHLKGSTSLYLFLATIGSDLEAEASCLMASGDGPDGYMLDRIGSFAVESIASGLEEALRRGHDPKGEGISIRFSPGYCDWPIEEQKILNEIMGFSQIGVELNESFMMRPKKSISGLMGAGPKRLFSEHRSQCSICNIKDCAYKRD